MTLGQIINGANKLNRRQTTNPHFEAEILLSKILKKSREFLLAHGEYELTKSQIINYKILIAKRLSGIPIAYITGEKEFYGLNFKVNKNVLIPRPETELMVEEALKLATQNSRPTTLIDVGTGSGCVIITLAKLLNEPRIMNYELWGIDNSSKALITAKQNARHHDLAKKIKFIKGNLLDPLIHNSLFIIHNSIIILANLPYLTPAQIKNSSSIKYEPKLALDGGPDGLNYYRQLFKQIKTLDVARHVLCEFDPRQTIKIKQLIKRELPEATFQIKKDLSGLNRLVIISIN